MTYAPIALFVYNRPEHTRRTLEALIANEGFEKSSLYIFCDGSKCAADDQATRETRFIVRQFRLGNAAIVERDSNLGLANSIISGVTELCERHGRVVVLEDDLITNRRFLEYMNLALGRYANGERVMQISGHMYPVELKTDTDAMFLPMATSWGWATWQRAWKSFDATASKYHLLKKDAALRKRFDLDGAYPYFKMLEKQLAGKTDSWAIRWYLSVFMCQGLALFPAKSLIANIGFDGSGVHCGKHSGMQRPEDVERLELTSALNLPQEICPDWESYVLVRESIRSMQNLPSRWLSWLPN
jgi:hypothetical protein